MKQQTINNPFGFKLEKYVAPTASNILRQVTDLQSLFKIQGRKVIAAPKIEARLFNVCGN